MILPDVLSGQGIFTGINNTVISLPCSQACTDLHFQVPHLKSDDDYEVISIPYTPYPYTTAGGNELTALYADDLYSQAIPLPFPLCFYGAVYNRVVVGSNGLLTFDLTNANCSNAYTVLPPIPYSGGVICDQFSTYYPRASVMGAYSDLDPTNGASPANRKIEWRIEGTAPFRRFIASWYRIGVYGNNSCGTARPTTFQIVINESTAVIEVFFEQKICQDASTGMAILGVQDLSGTRAVAAPGKNATAWTANREGYRFIPSGASSRFVRSELYMLNGVTPIATATTNTTTAGLVDISFSNICPASATQQYLVKTIYSSCIDPALSVIIDDTITINRLPMPVIVGMSPTTCNGANNGAISINPTGVPPYNFSLDGAPPVPGTPPYTFFNVSAGLHTVIAYDASGCETSPVQIDVLSGPPLTTTVNKSDVLCNGSTTGSITVTQPVAGTAPYEYSLDGISWQSSAVFNGLAAGTYIVYYRESSGCQGSQSITINEPAVLAATSVARAVVCNGQSNGTITVTANGGVSPYTYSLDGVTWQSGNRFNVAAGNYKVTTRDNNNCTTTQNITVTEPVILTASSVTSAASCDGGNDGVIAISATGGNIGAWQYSIDGTTFQPSNIFNVGPGNYTVTVQDNLGCRTSINASVGLNNNLFFTPQTDTVICEGTSTQLQLFSNGTAYLWTPAAGLSNAVINNPVASPVVSTAYIVTTTLGRCSANDTVLVNVNEAPVPDAGPDGFICYGQTYTLQASGGTKYLWSPSKYLDDSKISTPVSSAPNDIIYTLSILSDNNGCASLITDEMRLDVTPPIKVTTFPYDTIAYNGDKFQLHITTNDSDVINYKWTPSKGLSDAKIADPVVTAGSIGDDVLYKVITSTIAGCKGEGYVHLKVYKGPDIYVPTGFTPNNDGKNDRFTPFPVGIKSLTYFRVFNRWGQVIFSTRQLHDGWDGKIQGAEQPIGTYVWMIEAITNQDKVITKKGTVTLIR